MKQEGARRIFTNVFLRTLDLDTSINFRQLFKCLIGIIYFSFSTESKIICDQMLITSNFTVVSQRTLLTKLNKYFSKQLYCLLF